MLNGWHFVFNWLLWAMPSAIVYKQLNSYTIRSTIYIYIFILCLVLTLASDWLTSRRIYAYHTFDVISVRYKDKGTSLTTSHNDDHDPGSLLLPLRSDRVTPYLGQMIAIPGILMMWTHFKTSQTSFELGINSLLLVCFRWYGNLSTLSIAIPRLAFGGAWDCDAAGG